jgi:hypothetical protein
MQITSNDIILDNIKNKDLINIIKNGKILIIKTEDFNINTPDIIIYLNGPQYWLELALLTNNKYEIQDFKMIK